MQQQPLTGYILHARPYQEKRAIYQVFSHEFGVVHGIGQRGLPSFVELEMLANGKTALKNFSQIFIKDSIHTSTNTQSQYALLYLNEVIIKLIAQENPCTDLWQSYHDSVKALQNTDNLDKIKQILRQFESQLFHEMGVAIDWQMDSLGREINLDSFYKFIPNQGFIPSNTGFLGEKIINISEHLVEWGQIHRMMMDFLLDGKPLNSRKLWAEQLKFKQENHD